MSKHLKVLYVLSWVPMVLIMLTLTLLGLVAVPLALGISGGRHKDWPDMFWIWGNDESKGTPDWWLNNAANKWFTRYWPRFWWYAIRNPVNNHRFIFEDRSPKVSGSFPKEFGSSMEAHELMAHNYRRAERWSWRGPFASYRRVWLEDDDHYSEFWIGWKIGSPVPGMGFTVQWRKNRKVGT